ncbi:type II toxin-antitoxin system death-on-curing family toxin [Herbiconiux ginsengi]|uniref:Death on curing protein n=1 Tax=Herbiconiux ginsengi TaxID=381665 RepID=A0A1H3KXY1_9MICO|nr:type II toxin-antitoxin system death-on-curing family toxin [Herbiconiux ginsengi]SDY57023.1 death on curing protein [Herbiconiux ginsengi]
MTEYLNLEDALQLVERFGFVVRDLGLLESALARPSSEFAGVETYASLELKCAALLESVVRNHALLDGNKRTGWTAMVLTLWINGFQHDFATDDAFDLVLGVARGEIALSQSAELIAQHRVTR